MNSKKTNSSLKVKVSAPKIFILKTNISCNHPVKRSCSSLHNVCSYIPESFTAYMLRGKTQEADLVSISTDVCIKYLNKVITYSRGEKMKPILIVR